VYDCSRRILPYLLSEKLASGCGCLRDLDAKRLIHNVVFAQLERAGLATGWLAIFDRRSGQLPLAKRLSDSEQINPGGRRIRLLRL
jgi:hypothetical protein